LEGRNFNFSYKKKGNPKELRIYHYSPFLPRRAKKEGLLLGGLYYLDWFGGDWKLLRKRPEGFLI